MKLLIYNKGNSLSTTARVGERSIGLSRSNGMIYLSKVLATEIGLSDDDKIILANDEEDKKGWYLCKTNDELGFSFKNDKGGFRIINKFLVNKILNSLKIDTSATFLVGKDPLEVDDLRFYRIITSSPIINKRSTKSNEVNIKSKNK